MARGEKNEVWRYLAILGTTTLQNPADRGTMRVGVERIGIIAASSLMEEGGVEDEQPITDLGELQVGGWLFLCRSGDGRHLFHAV
jgi:hypothetical protein